MIYTKNEEIIELARKFEDCSLPKEEWTHAAHLTAALWYCLHHDVETVIAKMREGILKLNEAHGTPNTETRGYHETLTVFWTTTVWNYANDAGEISLVALANGLVKKFDSKFPLKFYSRERLFSVEARKNFVEADLENLETPQLESCNLGKPLKNKR